MVSQFPPYTHTQSSAAQAGHPLKQDVNPLSLHYATGGRFPSARNRGENARDRHTAQVSRDSDIDSDTRRCTRPRPHPPAHQPICLLSIQPVCPGCSVGQAVCQELERQPGASRALWSPSFMEQSPHGEGRPGWKAGGGSPRVTTVRCDQLWWEEKATPQGRRPRKGLQGGQGGSESFPLNRRVPRRPTGQVKGAGGRL